jgi:fructosamine-3-kinase
LLRKVLCPMIRHEFILMSDGRAAFRKFMTAGSSDRFHAEADGLRALAATGTVRTPTVLAVDEGEIITSRVDEGAPGAPGWSALGEQLAALHSVEQDCFGFTADNYCGDTPQPNPHGVDGHAFFAEHRLAYQGRLAEKAGLLNTRDLSALDSLCRRLPQLIPVMPPALLHGDLWRGNLLFDNEGYPVLIDPACYWGWAEAEIAMTSLFGSFPGSFYDSWEQNAKPQPGWRERLPLYNLYHLLNHLNLFGRSYYPGISEILRRYAR